MGNLRKIKKDIDNSVFEVISDCFIFSELHPDVKTSDVAAIVEEAVNLRNDLISRVNNPEAKDDPGLVKKYFRSIKDDLSSGTDKLCKRLSDISKKKK
jgi:hypothetical protein